MSRKDLALVGVKKHAEELAKKSHFANKGRLKWWNLQKKPLTKRDEAFIFFIFYAMLCRMVALD